MRFLLFSALSVLFLSSCEEAAQAPVEEPKPPELHLIQSSYDELPGWGGDDYTEIVTPLVRSCARILRRSADDRFGPLEQAGSYGDWQSACRDFAGVATGTSSEIKAFIENTFTPYQVLADDNPEGLFTGYYEATLNGSRIKSEIYAHPLYKRPDDLVMVDLGQFRDHLKGERIAGRVSGGNLRPYESREEIVAGNWPHNDQVLVWVDSAVDAFFANPRLGACHHG